MIYLASNSPRRRELIKKITDNFMVISPQTEESEDGKPEKTAQNNAKLKAWAVYQKKQDGFVIGADTIVLTEGKLLGKPKNALDAENMLKMLSGRTHKVITGVCVIGKKEVVKSCTTYVTFNDLTQDFIKNYVKSGKAFDKAGSYGIQDGGFVKSIKGSRLNVIGFPVQMIKNMLKEAGYKE